MNTTAHTVTRQDPVPSPADSGGDSMGMRVLRTRLDVLRASVDAWNASARAKGYACAADAIDAAPANRRGARAAGER